MCNPRPMRVSLQRPQRCRSLAETGIPNMRGMYEN